MNHVLICFDENSNKNALFSKSNNFNSFLTFTCLKMKIVNDFYAYQGKPRSTIW